MLLNRIQRDLKAHFSLHHSVFACHVLGRLRRFSTIGITHVLYTAHVSFLRQQYHSEGSPLPSPRCYVLPYLCLLYYFHSSSLSLSSLFQSFPSPSAESQMLQVVSVYVSVTSLSSLPPSLSQTVDWYGDTRLRVFLVLPQMGPWQHVRDQNVLYLSCQAIPRDQNGSRPLRREGGEGDALYLLFNFRF